MNPKRILLILTLTAISAQMMGMAGASASNNAGTSLKQSEDAAEPLLLAESGFTYQGRLLDGGSPANANFDFRFTLFDALSGGTQIGSPLTMANQPVRNGLFTVTLDFGSDAFTGNALWLQIEVKPTGGPTYTVLTPRQPLTPAPYALSLVPGAKIVGSGTAPTLSITGTTSLNTAVYGHNTGSGTGVHGSSAIGAGVYGTTGGNNPAILGSNMSSGPGVKGVGDTGYGVQGINDSTVNAAVYGYNAYSAPGVFGESQAGDAVQGRTHDTSGTSAGVYGTSDLGGTGVMGFGPGYGIGVYGNGGAQGVLGKSISGTGVQGQTNNGYAMAAGVSGTPRSGNTTQERTSGGWVKAMVLVSQPNILQCYNSQTSFPESTPPCGFSVTVNGPGDYTIDFNFTVNDRFVSITPYYTGTQEVIPALYNFPAADQARVRMYDGTGTLLHSGFFLIIY